MALEKEIVTKGVSISYWKISSINHNYLAGTAEVSLIGYVSQEVRADNIGNNIDYRGFTVPAGLSRQAAYETIKSTEEFLDAVDA